MEDEKEEANKGSDDKIYSIGYSWFLILKKFSFFFKQYKFNTFEVGILNLKATLILGSLKKN